MPWYDPFKDIYQETIRPSITETAEDWWENDFKPAVEEGIDNFIDSLSIPPKAEQWVQDKIVVPATTQAVKQTIKDNAVLIGIGLASVGLVLVIVMKK